MSASIVTPTLQTGIVKQILSGDAVIIRKQPKGGPPPEKQINFPYVFTPKLARRPIGKSNDESRDEAWAWEAREFLRKRLIGEEVFFTLEKNPNTNREFGVIYYGNDKINIVEEMVSEGLLSVRRDRSTPESTRLIELEDMAKAAGKGKWSNVQPVVRNIKWIQENPRILVEQFNGKPIPAIIEHVRDGHTVRAFLLPDFQYITLMITGIRCPSYKLDANGRPDTSEEVPYVEEAKFFVESRLLQRDVEIILESNNNANFIGSILFPKGNIAEALLREGFAKCVDWSMQLLKNGSDKYRIAEKVAKDGRIRLWKDYQSNAPVFTGKDKDFFGVVTEIFNGDSINVKTAGGIKKVFLSSIRPPRETGRTAEDEEKPERIQKRTRPLYDIPWMFESREFLRTRLIGKKVQCILDYISPARDNFPEKYCYTVLIGGVNVAEALVGKGLARVVRYGQDDDQRSSRYNELLTAESQAQKDLRGLHAKKDIPSHRINDLTVDHSRIKTQYLPSWQRALRTDAIIEFVASGSRFRIYIPKDSCIVTFLLAGIACPRSSRPALGGAPAQEGEPFGDEALAFTRDRILQHDVSIHVDTTDKAGTSIIGWLWTENKINLSVALVEEGLATVHFTAEKSEYYRQLKAAEDIAKANKRKIWSTYVEEDVESKKEQDKSNEVTVRSVNYEKVIITEITMDLHFYAQCTNNGPNLENLMLKLRKEFEMNPPIIGAYTPRRDDMCAAQFTEDNEWYRAKIERIHNKDIHIFYLDYGNREVVTAKRLAALPPAFATDKAYATEFGLALATLPNDDEDKKEACRLFAQDVLNKDLLLNIEYKINNLAFVTLTHPSTNQDICKGLLTDGIILVEKRREKKLEKLVSEYEEAQNTAKRMHQGIWQYGDITEDDAREFGN